MPATSSSYPTPAWRFALFEYGFRPFFLLSGLYALIMVPVWLWVNATGFDPLPGLPAMYWHAHELFFGFVCAAIAGFLLTAVPSWTGARGFGGAPLKALVLAWFSGRIVMLCASVLPFWLVAVAELAFLPLLASLLSVPLIRSRNRNTPLLIVLGVLWLVDAAFLCAMRFVDPHLAAQALRAAVGLCLVLVTVIGGRIVPSFTGNALRRNGVNAQIVTRDWVERIVIPLMVALVVLDMLWLDSRAAAYVAGVAAIVQAVRLSGWQGVRTTSEPIVWVLHVGYAWLPIGLALRALWGVGGVQWAMYWQHAFTAGTFATMIVAVMTRASLGHTGRPLQVSNVIALAYGLLTIGVFLRVFGGALLPQHYSTVLIAAGACWCAAFVAYLAVYAPILIGPRLDGKPG